MSPVTQEQFSRLWDERQGDNEQTPLAPAAPAATAEPLQVPEFGAPETDRERLFQDLWEGRSSRQVQRMRVATEYGTPLEPLAETRAHQIHARYPKIPLEVIRRNLDDLEKKDAIRSIDFDAILKNSPTLARWMQNPERTGLIVDDVATLSGLEWIFKVPLAAWRGGQQQAAAMEHQHEKMLASAVGLSGTAEEQQRIIRALERGTPHYFGESYDDGLFDWAQRGWVGMWNQFLPMWTRAAVKGGVPAAGGALVAGQLGPQVATLEELVSVPAAFAAGTLSWVTLMETGGAYGEISRARDEHGNPIDPKVAAALSYAAGAANGAMEMFGAGKALKMVPGGRHLLNKLGQDALTKALARPTFRRAVVRWTKDYAEGVGTESGTEMFQELTPILARIAAQKLQGGEWDAEDWGQNWSEVWEVGLRTFETMVLSGGLAAPFRVGPSYFEARRVRTNAARFEALVRTGNASNLRKRFPKGFREYVDDAAPAEAKTVYVPAKEWNRIWQEEGVNPIDAVERIVGQTSDYEQAMALGGEGDIAVPLSAYLDEIAPSAMHDKISQHVRLNQSDMTPAELDQAQRERAAFQGELLGPVTEPDAYSESEQRIYTEVYDQVLHARGSAAEADAVARLRTQITSNLARRVGRDPLDFFRDYEVRIFGPGAQVREEAERVIRSEIGEANEAGERPEAHAPVNPRSDYNGLARWMARNGGIAATEEQVFRENFPRFPGLARKTAGLNFDQWAERLVELWPGHFKDRAEAFNFLANEWSAGQRREALPPAEVAARESEITGLADELERVLNKAGAVATGANLRGIVAALANDQGWESISVEDVKPGDVYLVKDTGEVHTVRRDGDNLILADGQNLPLNDFTFYDAVKISGKTGLKQRLKQRVRLLSPDRGSIEFNRGGRTFDIRLFETANASTLPHELAHFHLEVLGDLAEAKDAAGDIRRDWRAVLAFLGVKNRAQITDSHHEKWAGAFEEYLREGHAPSEELIDVFARIKQWMFALYKRAKALVEINDDIRGVFDRMLASEEEIEAANAQLYLEPIPALKAHMTEQEWTDYVRSSARAVERKKAELRGRLLREHDRQLQEWFREEQDAVRLEVEQEFAKSPAMRALKYLQHGAFPGEEEVPGSLKDDAGRQFKLSKRAVIKGWGLDTLDQMPRRPYVYSRKGGVHPDEIAEQLGFGSGDELVKALAQAPDKYTAALQSAVDRKMAARYGDLFGDESTLVEEAFDVAQGPEAVDQLILDQRLLYRSLTPRAKQSRKGLNVDLEGLKASAEKVVAGVRVGGLRPHVYQRRAQKHGRQAFEAARSGNLNKAHDEKHLQLWNTVLYRAMRDARQEAEKRARHLQQVSRTPAQARLGKAGADYQQQVNALLEQFELRPRSEPDLRGDARPIEGESLREWFARKMREGEDEFGAPPDLVVSDELLRDTRRRNIRELRLEQLRDLSDTVKSIENLARLKTTLLHRKDRRDFESVKETLIASIRANLKDRGPTPVDPVLRNRGAVGRLKRGLRGWHAEMLRMREVFRRLDGNDPNGPWHQYIWQVLEDAQAHEGDLTQGIVLELAAAFEALPSKSRARLKDEFIHIQALDEKFSRAAILATALNTGNESNLQRLYESRRRSNAKWSPQAVDEILEHMTEADWQFVQNVWDTIESLWPQIAALEKKLTGIEPPKIEPRAVERRTSDGKDVLVRGGYYPLVYDRGEGSAAARKQLEAGESTAVLFDHNLARAMTAHGHVIKRAETFNDPLLLDLDIVVRHMQQVVHDLAYREAMLSIYRILNDGDVYYELRRHLGEEMADQFLPWLKAIASDRTGIGDPRFITGWAGKARGNMTIAVMGYKTTISLQNIVNFSNVKERVSGDYLLRAMRDFYGDWHEMTRTINGKSGEMRHRFNNLERDIRQAVLQMQQSGRTGFRAQAQKFAFGMVAWTDKLSAYPAWLAAYREAMDGKAIIRRGAGVRGRGKGVEFVEGSNEEAAIRHANDVVASTLGSAGTKDLAAIQRGSEFMKWITFAFSWYSNAFSRVSGLGYDISKSGEEGRLLVDLPWFLARIIAFMIIPATLGEIIVGRGPDDPDDPEDVIRWATWKSLSYPLLTIPFLRDAANLIEARLEGRYSRGIKYGPVGAALEESIRAAENIIKAVTDEEERDPKKIAKSTNRAMGFIFGLPSSQTEITVGYIYDVITGADKPENVFEFIRDTLLRRKPEPIRRKEDQKKVAYR